jgi:hypothetical protein
MTDVGFLAGIEKRLSDDDLLVVVLEKETIRRLLATIADLRTPADLLRGQNAEPQTTVRDHG